MALREGKAAAIVPPEVIPNPYSTLVLSSPLPASLWTNQPTYIYTRCVGHPTSRLAQDGSEDSDDDVDVVRARAAGEIPSSTNANPCIARGAMALLDGVYLPMRWRSRPFLNGKQGAGFPLTTGAGSPLLPLDRISTGFFPALWVSVHLGTDAGRVTPGELLPCARRISCHAKASSVPAGCMPPLPGIRVLLSVRAGRKRKRPTRRPLVLFEAGQSQAKIGIFLFFLFS